MAKQLGHSKLRADSLMEISVDSIIQLKLNREQEHEKTVIKRQVVPQDGKPTFFTYLTTERGAELEDASSSFTSLPSPSNECTSCAVLKLVSPADTLPAADRVVLPGTTSEMPFDDFMKKQKRHHFVLCQITLNCTISLMQLAVLLNTIHQISTNYDALKYNCYSYSYTLGEVVWREFDGLVSSSENVNKREQCCGFDLRKEDSVDQVLEAYRLACVTIQAEIAENERIREVQIILHSSLMKAKC